MGRRRRRSRGKGGFTRRRVLAGALTLIGAGVVSGNGSKAFDQVMATRGASVATATDENAYLGLNIEAGVNTGTADRGCHRTVLMAIDGFSVTDSKPAVCGFIEITVAMSNNANGVRRVTIRE
ncbi:hypothetical protein PNP85_08550 [Halobacterium salinarum]|uniref:hypothetical protein n=1 Tax=Halobacterium salinarum TaxID=2242 RepID=UPI00255216BB|nr:hypothetical protein [Halobacterium salinarum]MDL0125215.1 hypothetical protein [Halobacterium salinarum]MDL0139552.1 hypothetical protein [Halobacterium salinarum]